ncbi:MAG: hypothetical protein ACOY16_06780 [Chloroflexota bacterium]
MNFAQKVFTFAQKDMPLDNRQPPGIDPHANFLYVFAFFAATQFGGWLSLCTERHRSEIPNLLTQCSRNRQAVLTSSLL